MKKTFIKPHRHWEQTTYIGTATDLATGKIVFSTYKVKCECGKILIKRSKNYDKRTVVKKV